MKKVIHFLVLSCRKATELIDKRSVVPLGVRESIQLKVHKTICDACRVYESQSKKMDEILGTSLKEKEHSGPALPSNTSLKNRIISQLPE